MIYPLTELLAKLGAPEAKEKGRIEWFYFGDDKKDIAGHAGIRFEAGGEALIAELRRYGHTDEDGENKDEHFYMAAERTARPGHYRIITLSLDGETYDRPSKAIIELGLSVFHAKALDISITMVQQSLDKEEILSQSENGKEEFKKFMRGKTAGIGAVVPRFAKGKRSGGVVIPFPARRA